MTKRGTAIRAGLALSALLIVGLTACSSGGPSGITKAPVAYGQVTQVVEAPANVTPKSQITVDATAAGTVAQLMVADGQHVKAGQTLLRIDSPDAQAQLSAAKAADAQAAAQGKKSSGGTSVLDFSQSENDADANAQKAFDAAQATANQISDPSIKASILQQITSARNQYATASSDVRNTIANFNNGLASASDVLGSLSDAQRTQTQAAVAIAQKTVDSLTIKATMSGDVSLRSGVGGATASGVDVSSLLSQVGGNLGSLAGAAGGSLGAAASGGGGGTDPGADTVISQGSPVVSGAPLLVITDSSTLTVTAQVDETSILQVSPGVTANVQLDAVPDGSYPATVVSIDSQGQASSRGGVTYRVRLSLGAGTLGDGSPAPVPRPGMSAVADLNVANKAHVLAVPAAAVVHDGNQDTVWLVDSGVAHRHVVRLGAQGDTTVEVASGLNAGDLIVTSGADKVHDGQKL